MKRHLLTTSAVATLLLPLFILIDLGLRSSVNAQINCNGLPKTFME